MNQFIEEIINAPLYGESIKDVSIFLNPITNKTILDIGCGDGQLSLFFAMQGANIIGIDKRSSALKKATNLLAKYRLDNQTQFIKGLGEQLPLDDSSVDIIYSRSTIQYMNRDKALNEYFRVLKPDGKIALIENLPHNPIIKIFRVIRSITSFSIEQKNYINSINGYITHKEIDDYMSRFEHSTKKEFHLFRMLSIYLSRAFQTNLAIIKFDNFLKSADRFILQNVPITKSLAWFCSIYCEKKKQDV